MRLIRWTQNQVLRVLDSVFAWQFGVKSLIIALVAAHVICEVLSIEPAVGRNAA